MGVSSNCVEHSVLNTALRSEAMLTHIHTSCQEHTKVYKPFSKSKSSHMQAHGSALALYGLKA